MLPLLNTGHSQGYKLHATRLSFSVRQPCDVSAMNNFLIICLSWFDKASTLRNMFHVCHNHESDLFIYLFTCHFCHFTFKTRETTVCYILFKRKIHKYQEILTVMALFVFAFEQVYDVYLWVYNRYLQLLLEKAKVIRSHFCYASSLYLLWTDIHAHYKKTWGCRKQEIWWKLYPSPVFRKEVLGGWILPLSGP